MERLEELAKINAEFCLRTDHILKLKAFLALESRAKTRQEACRWTAEMVAALRAYQREEGLSDHGIFDAATRLSLDAKLRETQALGPHRRAGELLCPALQSPVESSSFASDKAHAYAERAYRRVREIVQAQGAYFSETRPQLLGIRAAYLEGDRLYRSARPSNEETLAKEENARKTPFDSVIVLAQRLATGRACVCAWKASVDPGSAWQTAGQAFDGTAHLRAGQYRYRLGRHSSGDLAHIEAICQAIRDSACAAPLQAAWRLQGEESLIAWNHERLEQLARAEKLPSRIQYRALVQAAPIEVYRNFQNQGFAWPGPLQRQLARKVLANALPSPSQLAREAACFGRSLDSEPERALAAWIQRYHLPYLPEESALLFGLSKAEFQALALSERLKAYGAVQQRYLDCKGSIAINIHSAPNHQRSSLACQNIPIAEYLSFIQSIEKALLLSQALGEENDEILYTLMDSSQIEAMNDIL